MLRHDFGLVVTQCQALQRAVVRHRLSKERRFSKPMAAWPSQKPLAVAVACEDRRLLSSRRALDPRHP